MPKQYTDPLSGEPNVPDFDEDDNSPVTLSGAGSYTYTLANNYDVVAVVLSDLTTNVASGTNAEIRLQLNGDTGLNYNYMDSSGTAISSRAGVYAGELDPDQAGGNVMFVVDGRWNNNSGFSIDPNAYGSGLAQAGINVSIASPLDSIDLSNADTADNWGATMNVYGWNK